MTIAQVSDKGQVTLPVKVRRQLGIRAKTKMDVKIEGNRIVMQPVRSIMDVSGILHERASGKPTDWGTIRRQAMEAVAREVVNEDGA